MPPRNLCEMFLRDVAALLALSRLINQSLHALRPRCEFSGELTATIDTLVTVNETGASRLYPALTEAGAILPASTDPTTSALIKGFFSRLPLVAPGVLAAEVIVNLRLLAKHLELKVRLAAEEALLVGQNRLGQVLADWSVAWRACSGTLREATVRARAQAYVADLGEAAATPAAD